MTVSDDSGKIAIFQHKKIRRQIWQGEWWFVIVDVVAALTDSPTPAGYLRDMRRRDVQLHELMAVEKIGDKGGGQFAPPLYLLFDTSGGKQKLMSWNTEGIFRLIQSIPSKKAEPFKRWLAKIGYEHIQEIENPELAQKRMKMIYRLKGYDEAWI